MITEYRLAKSMDPTFRLRIRHPNSLVSIYLDRDGIYKSVQDSQSMSSNQCVKLALLPSSEMNLTRYSDCRSYEITRKDRLYKNIEAMQRSKGLRNLDFIPQTFLLPSESRELLTAHFRYRGPWIVKPKASSRGRGIYIVNSVSIRIFRYKFRVRAVVI